MDAKDHGRRWFVMSAIGGDRPGIVADLAELIYDCDCNLEDSRMTRLGSEFAVLLLASGQGADVEEKLAAGCKRLEWEKRLTVFLRRVDGPLAASPAGRELVCTVTGIDKAGIVARVARTVAAHGLSVRDLRSDVRHASNAGTPVYTLRLAMDAPPSVDVDRLRTDLEQAAAELGLELSLDQLGADV
jgi:glycine cleavage system transcriptional repressor